MTDRHGADPFDDDDWFENNMAEILETERKQSAKKSSVTENSNNGVRGSDHSIEAGCQSTSNSNTNAPPSYQNSSRLMKPRSVSSSSPCERTKNHSGPSQSQQSSSSSPVSSHHQNNDKLPARQLFGSKEQTPKNCTYPSNLHNHHRQETHVKKLQNQQGHLGKDQSRILNGSEKKLPMKSLTDNGDGNTVKRQRVENQKKRRHDSFETHRRNDDDSSGMEDEFVTTTTTENENEDDDGYGEETQDNVQQSLTQEDMVDFTDELSNENDEEVANEAIDCNNGEESDSRFGRDDKRQFVQQTLTQNFKPVASPTPPLSKESSSVLLGMWKRRNYIDYKGNTYFPGSYWKLNKIKPSLKNVVVKLLDLSVGSDGNLVAVVDSSAFYIHLQHTYLDKTCAMEMIGGGFPAFVRYNLHFKQSGDGDTVRIPLCHLQTGVVAEHVEATKWEFGYDGVNETGSGRMDKTITATRVGCYFQYFGTDRAASCPDLSPDGMPTVVDLYCGAGGMTEGYHQEGFKTSFAVENNDSAANAYASNFREVNLINCDVKMFIEDLKNEEPSCPAIRSPWVNHASPPCQGVSTENRNGGKNDEANRRESRYAMDAVELLSPVVWTYEMVEGILYNRHREFFHGEILSRLLKLGYQVRLASLNAAEYGVPQNRWRVIIIAIKVGFPLPDRPAPTHGNSEGLLRLRTARDALGFLEGVAPREKPFLTVLASPQDNNGRETPLYLYNHFLRENQKIVGNPEDHGRDCTRILADKPVPTVTGQHETLHYDTKLKRWLTILEHALLQGFPPTFEFRGKEKEMRSQIGNAVPPPLARAIARTVHKAIEPFVVSMRQQRN